MEVGRYLKEKDKKIIGIIPEGSRLAGEKVMKE
jgi:predicted CoA-binding protein